MRPRRMVCWLNHRPASLPSLLPPTVLCFAEGWHRTPITSGIVNAEVNVSSGGTNGRYTSPNSRAVQITGSGSRWVWVKPPGMVGDWAIAGFNVLWVAEGQASVFAINRGATGSATQSNNTCLRFRAETNGDITVFDSTGATIGTLPSFCGAYHWVDIKLHAISAGAVSIWVDSTLVINKAAGDFAGSSATGTIWTLYWTDDQDSGSDNGNSTRLGEVLVGYGNVDAQKWGEHRAFKMIPDGVDVSGSFTANTGTVATATDDASLDNDTTYASTTTTDDEFFVGLNDTTPTTGVVTAVKLNVTARRTTGSSSVVPALKGTAQIYGTTAALTTSYASYDIMLQFNTEIAEDAPWTISAVNALKAGAKMSGSGDMRVSMFVGQAFHKV